MAILLLLLFGGSLVAGLALAIGSKWQFRKDLLAAWQLAARKCGLRDAATAGGFWIRLGLVASSEPLRVSFEHEVRSEKPGTKLTISGLGHGSQALTIKRQGVVAWIGKQLGAQDIELGASADSELVITGDEVLAQAVLDAATRQRLTSLLAGKLAVRSGRSEKLEVSLQNGMLEAWLSHDRGTSLEILSEQLTGTLEGLLDLARRLLPPEDPAIRLGERLHPRVGHEPEAGARLKSLRLLLRHFPQHAATAEALPVALGDASDEVRLEAALALGEEGVPTLRALVEAPESSDASAARALAALGPSLPFELVESALRHALETGRSDFARGCLEALGRLDGARAEPVLGSALRSRAERVATTAARLLGELGTVASVPALHQAEELGARRLALAARQAIAAIQARLVGAGEGQLSLAGSEAGGLSLASMQPPGRLSLLEEDPEETPPEPVGRRQAEKE